MTQGLENCRRSCRRLRVPPMYTSVTARGPAGSDLHGHVYDISEHGLRIELDQALAPGERVALTLDLPGEPEPVSASASVIWVNDAQDDPGPRRMALRFTGFARRADRARLIDFLGQGEPVPAE
jgi:hypothetical protein